jgi:glucosamine-6-phosphate deaminase
MTLIDTIRGSLLEGFLPAGWDLAKIDALAGRPPERITERERWWHPQFQPIACSDFADFDVRMGHEIARVIQKAVSRDDRLS